MYAVSLASVFTVVGLLWDISWHISIGRDGLFAPPHLLIYMGAVFAGLFSGVQVLWNTFKAPADTKKGLVKIWGVFYSSLGALFCIWGAFAMLTSAPFDDWWHNAYGLDVVILSPPHVLLVVGMLFLQLGACVSLSKYLNLQKNAGAPGLNEQLATADNARQTTILKGMFVIVSSCLLCLLYTLLSDYIDSRNQHTALFYQVVTAISLLLLPAFGRVSGLKWGMTAIAASYFMIGGLVNWILPLFPAVPRLGPVLNPVTHFQPLHFPLLVFIPAIAMDLVMHKVKLNDWIKAALMSIFFVAILLAVHYPFGGFLLESPLARNWFFGAETWYFGNNPDWEFRYKFLPDEMQSIPALLAGCGIAVIAGFLLARLSLRWGRWLQSVQR